MKNTILFGGMSMSYKTSAELTKGSLFENKVLPAHIDHELRKHIALYIAKKGQNSKSLHQEIDTYVRDQFKSVRHLVDDGILSEK